MPSCLFELEEVISVENFRQQFVGFKQEIIPSIHFELCAGIFGEQNFIGHLQPDFFVVAEGHQ